MGTLDRLIELLADAAAEDQRAAAEGGKAEANSKDPLEPLSNADKEIRATAKWMATSFAAIGGILVGGLGLTKLGDLTADTPNERVAAAVVGLTLAVGGVCAVIWFTSRVLSPFLTSFASLDQDHATVAAEVLDDGEVIGMSYAELKEGVKAADQRVTDLSGDQDSEDYREAAADRAAWELQKRTALKVVGSRILAKRFDDARVAILAGVGIAAVGVALFAWGTNAPKAESDAPVVLGAAPVQERVRLTEAGVDALEDARSCRTRSLTALAIADSSGNREVVTVPTAHCQSVRFVLTPSLGTAVAAGQLDGSPKRPPAVSPPVVNGTSGSG